MFAPCGPWSGEYPTDAVIHCGQCLHLPLSLYCIAHIIRIAAAAAQKATLGKEIALPAFL